LRPFATRVSISPRADGVHSGVRSPRQEALEQLKYELFRLQGLTPLSVSISKLSAQLAADLRSLHLRLLSVRFGIHPT
jgi:hypothetical protein